MLALGEIKFKHVLSEQPQKKGLLYEKKIMKHEVVEHKMCCCQFSDIRLEGLRLTTAARSDERPANFPVSVT
jgi:hypothetical protein